jgi:hypothetical protein
LGVASLTRNLFIYAECTLTDLSNLETKSLDHYLRIEDHFVWVVDEFANADANVWLGFVGKMFLD